MRRPLAAAGTALAAVLLASCGGTRAATPPTSPTASPAATSGPGSTTTAAGSATTAPYRWARAVAPGLAGGGATTLSAVLAPAATGGTWTAVGTVTAPDGSTTAMIWQSSDARSWTAQPLTGTDGQALAATTDGTRVVVVGSVGVGAGQRAAVWVTPPSGGTPVPVSDQASFRSAVGSRSSAPAGASTMDLVAAGTVGIVAAGSVAGQTAVWYSSNGTTWAQVSDAERLIGRRGATLTALLVDPNGVLAAGTARSGTQTVGVLWDSPNGIRWGSGTPGSFGPPGDHAVAGLSWTGKELVAVGGARPASTWSPAAWISPGGSAWGETVQAFPQPGGATTGVSVLRAVSVDPTAPGGSDVIAAVGGAPGAPSLWMSPDGQRWTPVPMPAAPPGATADLVATWSGTTVVADSEPGQPLVWVRRAGRWTSVPPATFGGLRSTATPVAVARTRGRLWLAVDVSHPGTSVGEAVILDSVDGRRWSRAAVLPSTRLTDLVAVGTSLVATGAHGAAATATVWSSPDGSGWRPVAAFTAAANGTVLSAATALGGATVAVGTSALADGAGPTAAGWHNDGVGWAPVGTLERTPMLRPQQPLGLCVATLEPAPTSGARATSTTVAGSSGTPAVPTVIAVGWSTRTGAPPAQGKRSGSHTGSTTTTTTVPVVGSGTGSAGQEDDGTQAATWSSANGTAWVTGTVSPHAGLGSDEAMDGCTAAGHGVLAWGQAPGAGGAQPALWSSSDGTSWTRVAPGSRHQSSVIPPGAGGPWTDVAVSGSSWLAVGGSPPATLALPDDPRWASDSPYPSPPSAAATAPSGGAGVWLSTDAGAAWQLVASDTAPWTGAELSTTVAAWAGANAVVAGDVNGGLAVWVGRPTASSGSSGVSGQAAG